MNWTVIPRSRGVKRPGSIFVKLKDLVLFLSLRLLGHSDYFENGSCETLHTWCRSRQILGCEGFLPEFSRKVFVWLLPTNFFSQRLWRPVCEDHTSLVWPANKVFICFWRKEVKYWAPFLPGFSGIFPGFTTDQDFWGALSPPAPPTPTPLLGAAINK